MDKWAPIAPQKPGGPSHAGGGVLSSFGSVLKPSKAGPSTRRPAGPRVGRWPEDILVRVIGFLPVTDIPAFARANRALARLSREEGTWEARCRVLGVKPEPEPPTPALSTSPQSSKSPKISKGASITRRTSVARDAKGRASFNKPRTSIGGGDDDFGDFGEAGDVFEDVEFGDFATPAKPAEKSLMDFDEVPLPSRPAHGGRATGFFAIAPPPVQTASAKVGKPGEWYQAYKKRHLALVPHCVTLRSSPSPSSSLGLLFSPDPRTNVPPSLTQQGDLLLALLKFLSPQLQPLHDWGFLRQALLSAADRFDSTCLVAFEGGDAKKDEDQMRIAAEASWKVWEAGGGRRDEWECGRVWVEKREVFYETGKWDATENIIKVPDPSGTAIVKQLDFTPMDAFMSHVLESFRMDAELAARIFPPGARVVYSLCERVSNDVIGEYINTLIMQTRIMSQDLVLRATAASFVQAWKLVDVAMEVLGDKQTDTPRSLIENSVYYMFEPHMDEYLDDETEWVKVVLDGICNAWDAQLGTNTKAAAARAAAAAKSGNSQAPQFLNSQNPDQVKRNVLAGFKDVLLLPVTIVPRTVNFGVNAIVAGGSHAVAGLSMLNPQKWASTTQVPAKKGVAGKMVDGEVVFSNNVPGMDDLEDLPGAEIEKEAEANGDAEKPVISEPNGEDNAWNEKRNDDADEDIVDSLRAPMAGMSASGTATPNTAAAGIIGHKRGGSGGSSVIAATATNGNDNFERLQLLVSLDTALELIHGDRDSLKRTETFAKYPGKSGTKVTEAIEEIFILLLKAVGDRHIAPGFKIATQQMLTYKPAEHAETASVAPLLQFFELVHVGDTIQSMVQVYFDTEVASYVDKTDFLNAVMREKKRFEGVLDDAVAAGLNAGIEVLMNQVEHIIQVKTGPREYYPEPGAPMELGATLGCREAVACLETHCNLLKGSTSKEVLEVFYQEVGIRLQGILQRHLKRQIISLEGGFQIIADLNAYHAFVASLKQQRITEDFGNLKLLGHVFIVEDAKDLAQIVRDVTRYGGTFTPEDIYEFIQRRADWKKIEKTVDKAMYALSVREDCVIM